MNIYLSEFMEKLENELVEINKQIEKEQNKFKEKYSENSLKLVEIYRKISKHDIAIEYCFNSIKDILSNFR
tara:strand:+ start:1232 stop:1444 length:213 start_codon:yes stop_codon:yes gene_type:complete